MNCSIENRPLFHQLRRVRVGVVSPFAGEPRDIVLDLLRQAHALTSLMSSAVADMGAMAEQRADSALASTSDEIKVEAVEALASLIGLASAVVQEG